MSEKRRLKVTFINKSDSLGGAAVVTLRLVRAMRELGVDARLLVAHKGTRHDFVAPAASPLRLREAFLADRLPLLLHNGMSRKTLFSIDAGMAGLPLWRHPWVRQADAVALGWINQGMLSLHGLRHLASLGKPLLWTMHDMWPMTGVCHHAHDCKGYEAGCGNCPLLGRQASAADLSARVHRRKGRLYEKAGIQFIAVSRWLRDKCASSSLLGSEPVEVIPNAFPCSEASTLQPAPPMEGTRRIIMVAARLDDPVKGLPLLLEMASILSARYGTAASRLHFDLVGELRHPEVLASMPLPYTLHGSISDKRRLRELYDAASVVISPSLFETLPGTLIEGMDRGVIPVAFDRGGQRDIVTDGDTGYLAPWAVDAHAAASNLADALMKALGRHADADLRLHLNAAIRERFSAPVIARRYISLIESLMHPYAANQELKPSIIS